MTDDSSMSQRDRRRQQYQANKPKVTLDKSDLKKWAGPAVLLLIVGGVVTAMVLTDSANAEFGCSAHYHDTIDVFIDGNKLLLNQAGDNKFVDGVGHHLHMHSTSPNSDSGLNLIHNHFNGGTNLGLHPENCFTYGDSFDMLSMSVTDQALTLRAAHGDEWQGTYAVGDGNELHAYGQSWDSAEWVELDLATLPDMVPPVASRLAIIYGEPPADVQAFLTENATPYPVASYPPGDADSRDPAHYTSFDDMRAF